GAGHIHALPGRAAQRPSRRSSRIRARHESRRPGCFPDLFDQLMVRPTPEAMTGATGAPETNVDRAVRRAQYPSVPSSPLALILAATLILGGCTGESPDRGAITLIFKHARILGRVDPIPPLLREFEARHPGVRVTRESLPWTSDEQHQFYAINLEGASPGFDVMMLDMIWVPEFARAGWLLDLSPFVDPTEMAAFFPSAAAGATHAGRVWALPWTTNVGMLYYRVDLLTRYSLRPPETWNDLVSQVKRIQAGERDPRLEGYLWQGKQYEGLVVNVLEAFWASGTDLLAADGRLFPDPDHAAEALAFLRGLIEAGVSPRWV